MLVMASILFWFDSSLISSVTFQWINDPNKDEFKNNNCYWSTYSTMLTSVNTLLDKRGLKGFYSG